LYLICRLSNSLFHTATATIYSIYSTIVPILVCSTTIHNPPQAAPGKRPSERARGGAGRKIEFCNKATQQVLARLNYLLLHIEIRAFFRSYQRSKWNDWDYFKNWITKHCLVWYFTSLDPETSMGGEATSSLPLLFEYLHCSATKALWLPHHFFVVPVSPYLSGISWISILSAYSSPKFDYGVYGEECAPAANSSKVYLNIGFSSVQGRGGQCSKTWMSMLVV